MGLLPVLLVAAGAMVGALLRWWLGTAGPSGAQLPWGTFAINVGGCFLLAAMPAVGAVRRSPRLSLLLGPGLLGGFTTVSTWAEESRHLADGGATSLAGAYVAVTLLACLVAAILGRVLARWATGAVR